MQDVADRVGLSRQLVSIVLRGVPGASEASRERVMTAARELGYHPDDSARMLRRRRSGQIGVLFTMHQPFEVDLVDALYGAAKGGDYSLALSSMGPTRPFHVALAELMRQRIEALIVLDTGGDELPDLPTGMPVLLLGGPASLAGASACADADAGAVPDAALRADYDTIDVANTAGIELAVRHLTELGHERIAYVGPERGPNAEERSAAYRGAVLAAGGEPHTIESSHTEAGGAAAATALLERHASGEPLPTALVCVNDHCAIGALHTLVRAGVSVPGDISVTGFDDSSAAALPFVELTTVRADPARMAQIAIDTVRARLEPQHTAAADRAVIPTLVVRGSTAPPRG